MSIKNTHTRTTRLRLACGIVCLLAISLSGCAEESTPTLEPVTITFAYYPVDRDYYEELALQFHEQHPHITVELLALGYAGSDAGASTEADVFVVSPVARQWLPEPDDVLALDAFVERDMSFDLSDFYPSALEFFARDGDMWAIPHGANMMVMYYNRDLFDRYGVPYPEDEWTWDDFLNTALALRDSDAGIYGYGAGIGFVMPDAVCFIYQHGGRILDDLQNPTITTFDDPSTIDALEWYAQLMHQHDVAPSVTDATNDVILGKVGMWMGWLSERGGLVLWGVGDWDKFMRWGTVRLPRDAQPATLVFFEGLAISSQTQHPDVSWHWVNFLSEHMNYRLMPARKALAESAEYEQQVGGEVAAAARASIENAIPLSPAMTTPGFPREALTVLSRAIERIIDGDSTPQEALDWAQGRVGSNVEP